MRQVSIFFALFATLVTSGCKQEPASTEPTASAVDGTQFLLTSEPADFQEVIEARNAAADSEDVVVCGRIGGSENPWIEDRAAFSIVDNSLKACSDIPGDECPKPWDYCCQTAELPTSTALVKVVDPNGDLVMADARTLLNLKELATVIVQGKAKRDDAGNLTILASGIYVKK